MGHEAVAIICGIMVPEKAMYIGPTPLAFFLSLYYTNNNLFLIAKHGCLKILPVDIATGFGVPRS